MSERTQEQLKAALRAELAAAARDMEALYTLAGRADLPHDSFGRIVISFDSPVLPITHETLEEPSYTVYLRKNEHRGDYALSYERKGAFYTRIGGSNFVEIKYSPRLLEENTTFELITEQPEEIELTVRKFHSLMPEQPEDVNSKDHPADIMQYHLPRLKQIVAVATERLGARIQANRK